jgi:transcriptional regulator with XRE-family HTH domain
MRVRLPENYKFCDRRLMGIRARIRQGRRMRDMNQKEVAGRASITQTTLSQLETSVRRPVRLNILDAIAFALDVDLAWLVFGIGPDPVYRAHKDRLHDAATERALSDQQAELALDD